MKSTTKAVVLSWLIALPGVASAAVRLPVFIGDHMVLQQNKPVALWGWAEPGEAVTVKIAGQQQRTAADSTGKWAVTLQPLKSGDPLELTVEGSNRITVKDVLVGEVWLASGQSNMAFALSGAARAKEEIAAANYPKLRVFSAREQFAQSPRAELPGEWQLCTPGNAGHFSAVAYFFGREVHTNLNVPVGLIVSAVGGTRIETWTAQEVLTADPECHALLEQWKGVTPAAFQEIGKVYREYQHQRSQREAAVARGEAAPPLKQPALRCHDCPSALYNGMIAPLVPYSLRGFIWYQGESNTGEPARYQKLLPALIQLWRRQWREPDLPFYFVQLPNYEGGGKVPNYAVLRESQRKTLTLPDTGMAVTVDIGEAHNIHPLNKQEVGHRLALWALADTYGRQKLVYRSPLCDSLAVHGDTAVVSFQAMGAALVARGGALKGFEVAGCDGKFSRAEARISGSTVEVRSSAVAEPRAVRYAWANNPEGCNLYNEAGLPASPFWLAQ